MNSLNRLSILLIAVFVSGFLLLSVPVAHAMTPVLSITGTGTGDSVQINVTGDANASVLLFTGSQMPVLGTTDANGSLSTIISSATYNIAANSAVYVKTGGLNGTMSNQVAWPYTQSSTTTTTTLTLSQSALLLNVGQTSTVTASASYLYLFSNSSPTIANVNLNASQITVAALAYGSTVAKICVVGSTTNCANITVTVQSSNAQQLNFSQNNFSIISGQNTTVTVTGGSGTYLVSNNSNANSIQATLNGSVVTLSATNTIGAAAITICTTDMNNCGIINVSSNSASSSTITFSQTNPVVPLGQSITVTIFGGVSGSNYYVSSNSNPSIVQANVNSNIITLIANASTGTSTLSVCVYNGSCGTLTATVSNTSNGGALLLSQNTVTILAGQSSNITISGGSLPYSLSATNSTNVFNGIINGNILTIYGVNSGTGTANVCSSSGCTSLAVTINSSSSTINPPTFSQNNILLNVGQQLTVNVSGTGSYYVANNSVQNVATVISITGSSVLISGGSTGSTNISICQSGGQCGTLYVTVSPTTNAQMSLSQSSLSLNVSQTSTISISGNGSYSISSNSNSSVASATINGNNVTIIGLTVGSTNILICQTGGQCQSVSVAVSNLTSVPTPTTLSPGLSYVLQRYLGSGDEGTDVLKVQQFLVKKGFLTATPNGHYGPGTITAVKKLQKANGIKQTGSIGSATKALLDKIMDSTDTTKAQQISQIQQMMQQLQAQLSALQ